MKVLWEHEDSWGNITRQVMDEYGYVYEEVIYEEGGSSFRYIGDDE